MARTHRERQQLPELQEVQELAPQLQLPQALMKQVLPRRERLLQEHHHE
jgi:hypothetical protein